MLSLTSRLVSSSAMARASGTERASRSSLATTRTSPARTAASASGRPGRARLVGQAVIEVDPFGRDAEPEQGFALRGEVLGIGAAAAVPDHELTHDQSVAFDPPRFC
jgi:hypothetical protein